MSDDRRLTDFKVLTFDCYGTLIDWETGLYAALKPWLDRHGMPVDQDAVLENFARNESAQQTQTPAMHYPELLAEVYRRMGTHWDIPVSDAEAAAFGASVGDWPAFADSPAALQYLKQHYKLVILSNVDRASFKASNARLGVVFDAIYTAEDIGSYKPSARNFAYLLEHLAAAGVKKSDILHTAESLFHDHAPARAMGLASCWIHRRYAKQGYGATRAPGVAVQPDFRFESMAALVEAHRRELAAQT